MNFSTFIITFVNILEARDILKNPKAIYIGRLINNLADHLLDKLIRYSITWT